MIPLVVPRDWRTGEYQVVASSAQAASEWDAFVASSPEAMRSAYERLSEAPLTVLGARQFPLKGKQNKPFWEYEITGADRLYYAVDREKRVVVVCIIKHAASTASAMKKVQARRSEFDSIVVEQVAERKQGADKFASDAARKTRRKR